MDKLEEIKKIPIQPFITKKWLQSHDFYYNKVFSDEIERIDAYSYRFPVYKYGTYTTLECEFTVVFGESNIRVDVFDYGTRDRYAPFYYYEHGNYDKILNIVVNNIDKKVKQLGFTYEDKMNADKN